MSAAEPWGAGQFMAVAGFRYCLGCQTYVVQEFADWAVANWGKLLPPVQSLIRRELDAAFQKDDHARISGSTHKPLGADCDREQWERVRALWAPAGS